MKISEQSHAAVASCIKEALARYAAQEGSANITDIHIQASQDSGELAVFNDDDEELASTIVDEWVDCDSGDFDKEVEALLRAELTALKDGGAFDGLCLLKPYSFVLGDEDKETLAELLLMDDEDTLLLDDELLKGLDEELDAFLKDLLKD